MATMYPNKEMRTVAGIITASRHWRARASSYAVHYQGVPLNEPVGRYSPFVINTEAEII